MSALGEGLAATISALRKNRSYLAPLHLFPLQQGHQLPVGQAAFTEDEANPLPRTHQLALKAAELALKGQNAPPDAIIIGCTTGGMLTTEKLLEESRPGGKAYRFHGLHTVAKELCRFCGCSGPALTISTACSSGAVALALALSMLRNQGAKSVLAGGVDSLCRLTFFGFHSLQLVDASGPKPLDERRRGMAVAEGAGLLYLSNEEGDEALADLLGAGLSCDAFHPATPHPEGDGAFAAMQRALVDADFVPEDIGYINLHGTGTVENDQAEARAIRRLFTKLPSLSSIKGASGHSLAASGAIEAIVAGLAIREKMLPANTGCTQPDPVLEVTPLAQPEFRDIEVVLSNSFGFGGNNASLVLAKHGVFPGKEQQKSSSYLAVHACTCLTGAGNLATTLSRLGLGESCAGLVDEGEACSSIESRRIRRLKRLSRLALAMAENLCHGREPEEKIEAVCMGTGWGALSETADFLSGLQESKQQFASPTDFIGSVHNSPAGQIAMLLAAKGANITTSGGDYSFEQALLAAELLQASGTKSTVVLGADEGHGTWSAMLDASVKQRKQLADGGGALLVRKEQQGALAMTRVSCLQTIAGDLAPLITALGGSAKVCRTFGFIFVGIPAAEKERGISQLNSFFQLCGQELPCCLYRDYLGEFASASAVAASLAVSCLQEGRVAAQLAKKTKDILLDGKGILVLGLGQSLSAMEFRKP